MTSGAAGDNSTNILVNNEAGAAGLLKQFENSKPGRRHLQQHEEEQWFYVTQTVHCHESYNVKNQLHAPLSYIKIFNYNPTSFKPITGSSAGMSQIIITHAVQQYKYNF
jgi:hypothetical protein